MADNNLQQAERAERERCHMIEEDDAAHWQRRDEYAQAYKLRKNKEQEGKLLALMDELEQRPCKEDLAENVLLNANRGLTTALREANNRIASLAQQVAQLKKLLSKP